MQQQSGAQQSSSELEQMQGKATEGLREARAAIEDFARHNPRAAVGIALGVGFVLGGGLTPRLLLGVGLFAARAMAKDYAKNQLSSITKGVFAQSDEGKGPGQGSTPGRT